MEIKGWYRSLGSKQQRHPQLPIQTNRVFFFKSAKGDHFLEKEEAFLSSPPTTGAWLSVAG